MTMMVALATDIWACAYPATHNYYLFSTVERHDWESRTYRRCMDNWGAYLGSTDYSWFNAEELKEAAQKKGDALMVSYVVNLRKYLDVAEKTRESWDYPTKQELARRRQVLLSVQKYAFSKTKTRLRSQHALLYMRCCMMLNQHKTNVSFWEQTASKFVNSVYRDMMRNIYAGALLKTGRADEATPIFVEQGDISSLYTYYYKKRSYEAIRQEYLKNPNADALPFLLQDFANNAQEAIDAQMDEYNMNGKLFIRNIKKQEAMQMCDFAEQVVKERKTKDPALWKSLEAWLQYLFDERQQARKNIAEAVKMDGRGRVKDNARVLRLYIEASQMKVSPRFDDFLAKELVWLEDKAREERGESSDYENHYTQAYDRLVHQVMVPRYDQAGRHEMATAFLESFDEIARLFYLSNRESANEFNSYAWNANYSTEYFNRIDTIPVKQLEQYFAYTQKKPSSALDRWLSTRIRHDETFFHELIGTKYLRLGQWSKAENHLEKVSIDFINQMNIAPFMAQRDFRVELWLKRQRIKSDRQYPGSVKTQHNQKLEFVREMMKMEQGLGSLEPAAKAKRAYDLAVRYAQASYAGDAWYLSRYGKSCDDGLRVGEMDMLAKSDELLQMAVSLEDFAWREKVLYARAYLPLDPWYEEKWDIRKLDYALSTRPKSRQYQAMLKLCQLENQNPKRTSSYVSRCDVLKQFVKYQKQER